MDLTIVKQLNNSFKIAFDSDYDKMKKIKVGALLKCKITKPRNYEFHKKYFALINMLYDNQDQFNNIDILRKALTIHAGYFYEWTDLEGVIHQEAKSISFAAMSEDDFSEFYNKTLDVIVIFFNFGKQDIIDNVQQYF